MTAGVRHSHLPRKLLRHRCRAGRPAVDALPYGDCARMLMACVHRSKSHRLQLLRRVVQRTPAPDLALLSQRAAEVVARGNLDRPEVRRHRRLPALSKPPADDCAPCGERAGVIVAHRERGVCPCGGFQLSPGVVAPAADDAVCAQSAGVILAHPHIQPLARRRTRLPVSIPAEADDSPILAQRAAVILPCTHLPKLSCRRRGFAILRGAPAPERSLNVNRAGMRIPRAHRSKHRIGRIQLSVMVGSPTNDAAPNVQRARMSTPRTDRRHCRHDARRGIRRLLRRLCPVQSQRHRQPQQQPKNPEPHHRRPTCLAAAAYRIVLLPKSGRGAGTLPSVVARCAMGGGGEIRRSAVYRQLSTLHPSRRTPRSQPSCGSIPRRTPVLKPRQTTLGRLHRQSAACRPPPHS